MRSNFLLASAILLALGTLCVPNAQSAPKAVPPTYLVHDLGTSDFGGLEDVNNHNVACGYISVEGPGDQSLWHAALFQEGRQIDLGTLGGSESFAYALNDQGQVVGESRNAAGIWHAFLWGDANRDGTANPGEMRDLGVANGRASRAYDINNRGEVVGEIALPGNSSRAFRWKAGKMSLPLVRGANRSSATWIGEDGTILGVASRGRRAVYHPARWRSGKIGEVIPFHPRGYLGSYVVGRSAPGDIWLNLFGGITGPFPYVLRKGQKRITHLEHQSSERAAVASVNRSGHAVGSASLTTFDDEGFETYTSWGLYWHGEDVYDLDELLQPESGFSILGADGINEAGWIAASAQDEEGKTHLVLLEPKNAL